MKTKTQYIKVEVYEVMEQLFEGNSPKLFINRATEEHPSYAELVDYTAEVLRLNEDNLYRQVQIEVDWREEVAEFIENSTHLDDIEEVLPAILEHRTGVVAEQQFIKMCELVIDLKTDGGYSEMKTLMKEINEDELIEVTAPTARWEGYEVIRCLDSYYQEETEKILEKFKLISEE